MRPTVWTAALLLALSLLAGCASPAAAPTPPQASTQAPAGPPAIAPAGVPDRSCAVAGDCAVRNVGNCCGYFPACVNRDSPVDPEAVRAECARTGTASICGWQDIQACDCVQGQCQAVSTPLGTTR